MQRPSEYGACVSDVARARENGVLLSICLCASCLVIGSGPAACVCPWNHLASLSSPDPCPSNGHAVCLLSDRASCPWSGYAAGLWSDFCHALEICRLSHLSRAAGHGIGLSCGRASVPLSHPWTLLEASYTARAKALVRRLSLLVLQAAQPRACALGVVSVRAHDSAQRKAPSVLDLRPSLGCDSCSCWALGRRLSRLPTSESAACAR